jgi:hypothetical protein
LQEGLFSQIFSHFGGSFIFLVKTPGFPVWGGTGFFIFLLYSAPRLCHGKGGVYGAVKYIRRMRYAHKRRTMRKVVQQHNRWLWELPYEIFEKDGFGKMKSKLVFALSVLLVFGLVFMACDIGSNGTNDDNNGNGDNNDFVPVTNISGLPQMAIVGSPLSLSGIVEPSDATNKTIVWGGDKVSNGSFTATSSETFSVTATIVNGATKSSSYTKTFDITAYVGNNTANGTWKRGKDTLKKDGNTWEITFSAYNYTLSGIITMIEGSKAYTQIAGTFASGNPSTSGYTYAAGTYNLNGNKLTLTNSGLANGEWTKQ